MCENEDASDSALRANHFPRAEITRFAQKRQIQEITEHKHLSLENTPELHRAVLKALGFFKLCTFSSLERPPQPSIPKPHKLFMFSFILSTITSLIPHSFKILEPAVPVPLC